MILHQGLNENSSSLIVKHLLTTQEALDELEKIENKIKTQEAPDLID